jgi:hypothetical protein
VIGLVIGLGISPSSLGMVAAVRRERLTYLGPAALRDLACVMPDLERRARPGSPFETGCWLVLAR